MNRKYATALALLSLLVLSAQVDARTWKVVPDMHSTTEASFTSKAAIVKFSGRTTKVEGQGEIHVADPALNPTGDISVDVSSLDTGIPLRNEHLRATIEAAKYPTASFKVKSLKAPKLIANQPVEGTVTGEFSLHGVTRTITAPVTLTYLPEEDKKYRPGDWVAVSTEFKAKLSDYGIQLPKPVLGVKIADELILTLDGMAKGI